VHDVVKDYDAVMSSREHLWERFGEAWGWPPAGLTLEQDLIDLGWHQKEFQRRSSVDYAVMSLDDCRLPGCVYVDPPEKAGYDAEVWLWVRASELGTGLEAELYDTVRRWLRSAGRSGGSPTRPGSCRWTGTRPSRPLTGRGPGRPERTRATRWPTTA
jgi:hypothetical protein